MPRVGSPAASGGGAAGRAHLGSGPTARATAPRARTPPPPPAPRSRGPAACACARVRFAPDRKCQLCHSAECEPSHRRARAHHAAMRRSISSASASSRFLTIMTRSGLPLGHHSIARRRNFAPMSSQLLSSLTWLGELAACGRGGVRGRVRSCVAWRGAVRRPCREGACCWQTARCADHAERSCRARLQGCRGGTAAGGRRGGAEGTMEVCHTATNLTSKLPRRLWRTSANDRNKITLFVAWLDCCNERSAQLCELEAHRSADLLGCRLASALPQKPPAALPAASLCAAATVPEDPWSAPLLRARAQAPHRSCLTGLKR